MSSFAWRAGRRTRSSPRPRRKIPASPAASHYRKLKPKQRVTEKATPNKKALPEAPASHNEVVIKAGPFYATHGKIENGSILSTTRKIAAVGQR